MNTAIITVDYNSTPVFFQSNAFINATAIAKQFKKRPETYLNTDRTQEYIKAVALKSVTKENQLVRIVQGGKPNEQGTWLHPKLAIDFARWLSADFAVWCDEQIEKILHPQKPISFQIPTTLSEALLLAGKLAADNENKDKQLEAQKPAVDFAMNIRDMKDGCSVENFAKVTGYGRNTYFKMLRDDGFLMKSNAPYQKYIDAGWFRRIEEKPYADSSGTLHPTFVTVITGKGQAVLEKKYRKTGDSK